MRSNILLEVLKAFGRAVDADEVEDEEHAGRLVGSVSFYFRRNHAVCLPCVWSSVDDLPVVLVFVAVVILPGTITSHRCACCRRACSCCPGSSVPVVFFVRVRAILDVAVDAHVPLGRVEVRAAVLHDGAVDLFLNCTSRLDDDNVVLAGCELLEAFVHATFDPATLWQYLRHGLLQRSCSGATITSPVESIA